MGAVTSMSSGLDNICNGLGLSSFQDDCMVSSIYEAKVKERSGQ
jgi:hypothetical protein